MAHENPRSHPIIRLAVVNETTASSDALLEYLEELKDALANLQWMWSTLVGSIGTDGVVATARLNGIEAGLVTVSSPFNMKVSVKGGVFVVDNTPFRIEDNYTTPDFVAPSAFDRIDVIVAADQYADISGSPLGSPAFAIITGAEGASPVAPSLTQGMVKLAEVYLRPGMSQIESADSSGSTEGYITVTRNVLNI